MTFKQLTSWKGEINRRDFLIWGIILFAVKYNLDRLMSLIFFSKHWYIVDYFVQADNFVVSELNPGDRTFYFVLLAQSLPFVLLGTGLCLKRLRSANAPTWAVVFFFIPFINFIMFIILAAIPERDRTPSANNAFLEKILPSSQQGSALFAVALVLVISLAVTGLLLNYLQEYGWSLFVGIPFFLGFGSVLIYGYRRDITYRQSMGVAFSAVIFFSGIIFILAFEGIICLVMALPIVLAIALIGASIGYAITRENRSVALNTFFLPVITISMLGLIEHSDQRAPFTFSVQSEITIAASRQEVWNELVAFSEIGEPDELLFKTGIAYPIRAEMDGFGPGAVRKCNFTTGPFIEPIQIWDEPNVLEFGVLDQPPPMIEWTIYKDLEIAHIDGYFKSTKGQFKLEELADGKTRLLGTTWYHHDIWPSFYWKIWSDYILHRIHMRVLRHIKIQAEVIAK